MKRFLKHHKFILSIVLVALIGVGATSTYLLASSGSVRNTFASGEVDTEIKEVLEGGKQVSITNDGDLPVYVRARIVVGGAQTSQLVYTSTEPTEEQLLTSDKVYIVLGDTAAWTQTATGANNWYYYTQFLPANSGTDSETPLLMTKVLIGANANVDSDHFDVTITQESVVAGDTTLTAASDIEAVFAQR